MFLQKQRQEVEDFLSEDFLIHFDLYAAGMVYSFGVPETCYDIQLARTSSNHDEANRL